MESILHCAACSCQPLYVLAHPGKQSTISPSIVTILLTSPFTLGARRKDLSSSSCFPFPFTCASSKHCEFCSIADPQPLRLHPRCLNFHLVPNTQFLLDRKRSCRCLSVDIVIDVTSSVSTPSLPSSITAPILHLATPPTCTTVAFPASTTPESSGGRCQ